MQANMDKRGMANRLVQGSVHSNPEERKPEGVLQLSHNKHHSRGDRGELTHGAG